MLTAAQKSDFNEHGWVRVPGMIPDEDVRCVLDRVWDDLEQRCGIPRGDPENWPEARPKGFNTLTRSGAFEPTCSQAVHDAIDESTSEPGHWEKPNPLGFASPYLPWERAVVSAQSFMAYGPPGKRVRRR